MTRKAMRYDINDYKDHDRLGEMADTIFSNRRMQTGMDVMLPSALGMSIYQTIVRFINDLTLVGDKIATAYITEDLPEITDIRFAKSKDEIKDASQRLLEYPMLLNDIVTEGSTVMVALLEWVEITNSKFLDANMADELKSLSYSLSQIFDTLLETVNKSMDVGLMNDLQVVNDELENLTPEERKKYDPFSKYGIFKLIYDEDREFDEETRKAYFEWADEQLVLVRETNEHLREAMIIILRLASMLGIDASNKVDRHIAIAKFIPSFILTFLAGSGFGIIIHYLLTVL